VTERTADAGRRASALSRLLAEIASVEEAELPDRFAPGLPAGAAVGRFLVLREIGRGGFGVVYEALDPELARRVALKVLRPGSRVAPRGEEWVRREAEAVARLNHPGIVTLHDFGRADQGAYLVFELLRGETLAERLARGKVPLEEALAIGGAIAAALAHAHRAEVLHRDLKPANVFLCAGGGAKVLDFGVAQLFGRGREASGGTPAYMAPEQRAGGPVDARADLYALGVLLHELLAGPLPPGEAGEAQPGLPRRPRASSPPELRQLVGSLTAAAPDARPSSAGEVEAALGRIAESRAGRGRRGALAGLAALALAALALAGWALFGSRAEPRERLPAVIADGENLTGDPDLDRMGDLLGLLLAPSRRVEPLARGRLDAIARRAGLPPPARLDDAAGRKLARLAGAGVLLVPSARRDGELIRVTLKAVSPDDGRTLFAIEEQARGKPALPAALDRLMTATRARLRERKEDLRDTPTRLARMATGDLTAFRHYLEGLDCAEHPSGGALMTALARCGPHFDQAIALDPEFALAHYQLATLLGAEGAVPAEVRAHMAAALSGADRLSRRDATLIRAFQAHVEGRDDLAEAAYDQLVAAAPDDREALYQAGDVRFHRGELAGAIPFFQKALSLQPGAEWPLEHLMECYAVTGRNRELSAMAKELRALPSTPERSRLLVRALAWLGEPRQAVEQARRAVAEERGPAAEADLCTALLAAGELAEAEAVARRRSDFAAPGGRAWLTLISVLMAEGRDREASRLLVELPRRVDGLSPVLVPFFKAALATGAGDPAALWRESARVVQLVQAGVGADRSLLIAPAVQLALRGEPARAREVSSLLPAGTTGRAEAEALLRWRSGDAVGAAAALVALESTDPWPEQALAPAYLLAEVHASQGEWREAAAAVRRYQRLWPRGFVRSWVGPRALYLSALAHARLGDRATARAETARLLGLLDRADRGLPLLGDARRLQRELRHRG
jgi:tetratricopeptide (TPR) repeat protein